jgi:hypothetical protein
LALQICSLTPFRLLRLGHPKKIKLILLFTAAFTPMIYFLAHSGLNKRLTSFSRKDTIVLPARAGRFRVGKVEFQKQAESTSL